MNNVIIIKDIKLHRKLNIISIIIIFFLNIIFISCLSVREIGFLHIR